MWQRQGNTTLSLHPRVYINRFAGNSNNKTEQIAGWEVIAVYIVLGAVLK